MSSNNECVSAAPQAPQQVYTIREHLDERIRYARQQVENACIARAKAEMLGLLDAPREQLERIIYG